MKTFVAVHCLLLKGNCRKSLKWIWCRRHKIEGQDSSAGMAEGVQDTAQTKENELETQRKATCSQWKDFQRYSICNRKEADIDCEVKGCLTTYRLQYAASDGVKFVKNIDKGVDRLYCKNHRDDEEDRNNKKAHGSPSDGCCRSSSDEDENSNHMEENLSGRVRKCQKHPSYLLGDGTLKDSSVPKAAFQDLGSFRKAKSFWTRVQATGSVNGVFEQINDVLNCLKQKITDGSANDQEYLKAFILLNKAGIQNSSLAFDTPENEEKFQHDSEEISENVVASEEMEAQSISNSSLFNQTSVIKSLPTSATCRSPMEGLIHPSLPDQLTFQQHRCSGLCIAKVTPPTPDHFKGENPLRIPILCQFQRRHGKLHWNTEVLEPPHVSYKAPCGRGLRNFKEVRDYIFETQCDFLLLDFFSFNTYVQLSRTVPCKNPVIYEADISHGIEPVPIPLYNAIDVSKPQYFKYRKTRLPRGYLISSSAEMFLQKCNCTDGCSDKSRCACQQLTACVNKRFNGASGYEYKRLLQCVPSGLYECNKWCKCNERMCENRVVQQGVKTRLQLFKTKKKGWGVRCMDDVDEGTFVCCYAGRVLNIGVENQRHDKTVNYDIGVGSSKTVKPSIKVERKGSCLDSDIELIDAMEEAETDVKGEEATPFIETSSLIQERSMKLSSREKPEDRKSCLHDPEMSAIKRPKTKTAVLQARRRKLLEQGQISVVHSSSEEDNNESSGLRSKKLPRTLLPFSLKEHQTLSDNQPINSDKGVLENRSSAGYGRNCSIPLGENIFESRVFSKQETNKQKKERSNKKANTQDKLIQDNHHKELTSKLQRTCNGDKREDCCYFLDATKEGNIGRFINHSCDPNLMVQSVFVDTHDKNFPWVAFFTNRYIKAGSELTWDYRYSTGSMPEEEIPCLCGSVNCRNSIV